MTALRRQSNVTPLRPEPRDLFRERSGLAPDDVLVLTERIEEWGWRAERTFGYDGRVVPWTVTDAALREFYDYVGRDVTVLLPREHR